MPINEPRLVTSVPACRSLTVCTTTEHTSPAITSTALKCHRVLSAQRMSTVMQTHHLCDTVSCSIAHPHADISTLRLTSAQVVYSITQLEADVAADPKPWTAGTKPGAPNRTPLQDAVLAAGGDISCLIDHLLSICCVLQLCLPLYRHTVCARGCWKGRLCHLHPLLSIQGAPAAAVRYLIVVTRAAQTAKFQLSSRQPNTLLSPACIHTRHTLKACVLCVSQTH